MTPILPWSPACLPELQAAVANFTGSFNRQSPTIKGGTTAGAVLWDAWHENKYTCQANETPLDCELRLNKPSIVIINLGTHYENAQHHLPAQDPGSADRPGHRAHPGHQSR